nr:ubiquitin-like protein-specific protease ESD4 [Ipomoea batatas]
MPFLQHILLQEFNKRWLQLPICAKMDFSTEIGIFVPIHKEVHWCLAVITHQQEG